jgi:hypothetical protein
MRAAYLTIALCLALIACSEEGHQVTNFATYQACFDDHHDVLMPMVIEDISECCLLHKVNGERNPCGDDVPTCIQYLTDNLAQTAATFPELEAACNDYIDKRRPKQ